MPADVRNNPISPDWTVNTLYAHLLQVVGDVGKRVDDHLVSQEKAFIRAESGIRERFATLERNVETRFETFNEIRQTASDAAAKGISRTEVEAKVEALNEKISSLYSRVDKREGSGAGMANLWAIIAVGFSLLVGMAGIAVALLRK